MIPPGCTVHGYDQDVKGALWLRSDRFHLHKVRMVGNKGDGGGGGVTMEDEVVKNGDADAVITYYIKV